MPSLRDHLVRTPQVRPRNLAAWMAPALGEHDRPMNPRLLEEAALSVFAHIVGREAPTREQLVFEQRRFERLVQLVHRLPERIPEREGGG